VETSLMKWWLGLGAAALAAVAGFGEDASALKVGDKAPNFKLAGSDGKEYTLEQFRGKSAVVIAWYPKALTGG
jgi:thioredoxin-dependent peroxiredoxin